VAIDLMQIYSETAEGVHLHESVPGWLLACRRPWNRPGAASIADDRHEPNERRGCAANDAELRRLFDLHIERFGGWAYHQARSGPWKLAMAVAEREKALGDQADLESVDHLFWWSGDMAFAQRLRPSEERFAQALDWIAEVVDYHNTTRPRWRRRTKARDALARRPTHAAVHSAISSRAGRRSAAVATPTTARRTSRRMPPAARLGARARGRGAKQHGTTWKAAAVCGHAEQTPRARRGEARRFAVAAATAGTRARGNAMRRAAPRVPSHVACCRLPAERASVTSGASHLQA
jgi:hypothetical protein